MLGVRENLNSQRRARIAFGLITALAAGLVSVIASPAATAATSVTLSDTDALAFVKTNAVVIRGTAAIASAGTAKNDIVLYKNVGTFGGVAIDAAVTTVDIASGSISNFDNPGSATTATGYLNNFMMNTVGGEATVKFEFFKAGTYTAPNTGIPVVLQNVKVTSIDLDSSGTNGFQYSDFTGFQKYSMMNPTNLAVQPLDNPARVRFIATKTGARSSVPEDQVLIKYDAMQTMQVNFGNVVAGQTNYFGLVFGGWPGTGVPVEYPNVFNAPPTSESTGLKVLDTTTAASFTVIPISSFPFADADNNPFTQVKIATVSAGTLVLNGSNVTAGQVITVADIEAGKLKYNPAGSGASETITYYVYDGLQYSVNSYTLTLTKVGSGQVITFSNPGTKAPGATFGSSATSTSGLTVLLTSLTTGVCTIDGLNIVTVAAGTCIIRATQPGDATTSAASPVEQTFLVASGTTQTITFNNPGSQVVDSITASGATASSGLTVTLTSLTPTICTVSGLSIVSIAAGNCTIEANQPGNGTYGQAPSVSQTFAVTATGGADGTPPATQTLGASLSSTIATLTGAVQVNGSTTNFKFCYVELSSAPATTVKKLTNCTYTTAGSTATDSSTVTAPLTFGSSATLKSSTTYYYQVIAWHSVGSEVYGSIMKFTTSSNYIQTKAATSITTTGATLNGIYTNKNSKTRYPMFCLSTVLKVNSFSALVGPTGVCETKISSSPSSVSKDNTSNLTGTATGLQPYTVYYFQAYINKYTSSTTPSAYGNIYSFRTSAQAPVAVTLSASDITATSGVLNGSVNPNGPTTTVTFEYGTTTSLGTTVNAIPNTTSGSAPNSANYELIGLTTGQIYYYKVIAAQSAGSTVSGEIKSFTVGAPQATTLAAANVAMSSGLSTWQARVNGYIKVPASTRSTNKFCLSTNSTTNSAGAMTACTTGGTSLTSAVPESSTVSTSIYADITGLTGGTTYYFQAVGINETSTPLYSYGETMTINTSAAPTVTTENASSIAANTATLNGTLAANSSVTAGTFCLSTSNSNVEVPGVLDSCRDRITSTPGTVAVSGAITGSATGLSNATTYYFQAIGENARGTVYGAIKSFLTLAGPPVPVTTAATNIGATTATVNGSVNPGGSNASVRFCYVSAGSDPGTSSGSKISGCTYWNETATVTAAIGTSNVSMNLTGLTAGSTYYFQVVATNAITGSGSPVYGDQLSFVAGGPVVITLDATSITSSAAILNGTAISNGSTTTVSFCITTDPTLGAAGELNTSCTNPTTTPSSVSSSTTSTVNESATATVSNGTKYYFQIKGVNARGTVYGAVKSFTVGTPVATTSDASSVAGTTATLNGFINPNGDGTTTAIFCLSDSPDLDDNGKLACDQEVTPAQNVTSGSSDIAVNYALSNLNPGSTYYFQAIANGGAGASIGSVFDFQTDREVIFYANGASGSMGSQFARTTTNLSTNTFNYSGYDFVGWNTASDASGETFTATAQYDFLSNLELYAQWSASAAGGGGGSNPGPAKQNPTITWNNPAPIEFGTLLSGTQLNALLSVPGTCVYTPPLGSLLPAGTQTLSVTCTPTDGNTYNTITARVTIVVKKAKGKPSIIWFNPTPITNPTPLSAAQLNAAASVPGRYTYSPARGTILPPGSHVLTVHFVPTNSDENEELDARVNILVKEKNKPEVAPQGPTNPELPPVTDPVGTPPSSPSAKSNGVLETVKVIPNEEQTGYEIQAATWAVKITSTTKFVQSAADTMGRVTIEKGNTVTTSGIGFKPNTQVDVYVFSTPTYLGSVITDALGNFTTTLPMPDALKIGDHTFQVNGKTPDEAVRTASVPITLLPTPGKPGKATFSIYYKLDTFFLYDEDKATIMKYVKAVKSKLTKSSKVTIDVVGWVQPTVISPHVEWLSINRARAVSTVMRSAGLKGKYILNAPGHDKLNIRSSRRAEVTITWTNSK